MEIKKVSVKDCISKNYSESVCKNCNNNLCKVYGGRCNRYSFFKILKKIFRIREKNNG